MSQDKPIWEELDEFQVLAERIIEKYPDEFMRVNADGIVAFKCINKDRPDGKAKDYEMTGITPPESFKCSKMYFVKVFESDWEAKSPQQKQGLVLSALFRIDPEAPGKVGPLDLRDQSVMVRTFGADWQMNDHLPDILKQKIDFKR